MTTAQEMATDPAVIMVHANYRPRVITSCAEIDGLHRGADIDLAVIILGMFVDLKTS